MRIIRLFYLSLHPKIQTKTLPMQRWLKILLLVMTLSVCGMTHASASCRLSGDGDHKRADMLMERQANQQAVLSNANDLARICCSRPERVVPSYTNFCNTLRSTLRSNNLFHIQKATFCHYRGLGTILSRRIAAVPSSAYYVLTLRHLIC